MSTELLGELLSVAMFLTTIAAVMAGYPVAFTLAGVGLFFAALGMGVGVFDTAILSALAERYFGTMTNETLVAVPLFVVERRSDIFRLHFDVDLKEPLPLWARCQLFEVVGVGQRRAGRHLLELVQQRELLAREPVHDDRVHEDDDEAEGFGYPTPRA